MRYLLTIGLLLAFLSPTNSQEETKKDDLNTYFSAVKWRNIGPFRGGRSVCASGVIGDPMTYYMGTTGGGLWKTEDAGQHWKNISDGFFKTGSVGAVAVSASHPNVVYCGMGEHAPRGVMTSYGDGVYKSNDAGKTWQHVGLAETQQIARIIINPDNPNIVYVAAQGALHGDNEERGIFKTTDGGKTWEKVLYVNAKTGCSELSMDANNSMVLYAGMWEHQRLPWKVISGGEGSGVYKSIDGGATWNKIHNGLPEEKGKVAISVSPSNSNKVYCLLESDTQKEKGGLFVSNNAGKSWSRVSGDHRLIQRAWYYTEVFTDPENENMVYVLSAPALRSSDGGKTWERLYGTHGDHHDLWINPNNPKNLCIANDGGAAISFNRGVSWSRQSNMPTAQFYRVTVDNLFPYNIYGGQQDNTSIKIASQVLGSRYGITEANWWPSAGGESAFLAFDPDNPRYVLGGSYLGTIETLDTESGASTNIMPAPIQYLGRAASDMKYRYNWNAPIIRSQHEANTFYHAAQYLLKTSDMGKTWTEASPDLSKNEKDKQIKGGGPYTVEAVGAENYGTISYVMESPHEAGVIWVATDDGNVQLTKDNCATWQNVTPKALGESLVNAIDISPHNPGTAYIAATRYKFNDKTPSLWKTDDYGKTWSNISEGIPYGAYTRVVREDSERKGMLIAGTEQGVYISYDDGAKWQALQLNLPVTPINDLIIAHDDIIVATSGRSFWVLDDLELLRQYDAKQEGMQIFQPANVTLVSGGSPMNSNSSNGTNPLYGVNPATGAVLYYYLPELEENAVVELEIKDANGDLVRRITSEKDKSYQAYAGGPPPKPTLGKSQGLNRFVWDLRYPIMEGAPTAYIEGSYKGHKAIPGTYSVRLKVGETTATTSLEIKPNPLYETTMADYQAYHEFMQAGAASFNEMHQLVNQLYEAKKQIENLLSKLPDDKKHAEIHKLGKVLVGDITAWDGDMIQRLSKAYDDVENYENKFTANYLFAINHAESSIPSINQATRDRKAELDAKWVGLKATAEQLAREAIPAFNKMLWDAGVGAVWTP